MSHKAGADFFETKKEWSKYKDLILAYYLRPYLSKVKDLNRPILLADLFAGPGRFDDGSPGSPVILLDAATSLAASGHRISVLLIEQDKSLFAKLETNTRTYGALVERKRGNCIDFINEIAQRSLESTTLLYVDPFSISRLHLGQLSRIFERINVGSSVELLFVFMAHTFMRWASSCLRAEADAGEVMTDKLVIDPVRGFSVTMAEALWDAESVRIAKYAITSNHELDAIAGGDYWRSYVDGDEESYPDRLSAFVEAYCNQLRRWFSLVCKFPIFAKDSNRIPKYWMLFGTRYRPAIDLINRAMAKARQEQYDNWKAETLFANVPLPPVLSQSGLERLIVATATELANATWESIRWTVSEKAIGEFTDSQINNAMKHLLQTGRLRGADGSRVEKHARLSHTEPAT